MLRTVMVETILLLALIFINLNNIDKPRTSDGLKTQVNKAGVFLTKPVGDCLMRVTSTKP